MATRTKKEELDACVRQSMQAHKNFDHLLSRPDVDRIMKRCGVSRAIVCAIARSYKVRMTRGACGISAPKKGGDQEAPKSAAEKQTEHPMWMHWVFGPGLGGMGKMP